MGQLIDLTGKKFGRLTVIGRGADTDDPKPTPRWVCICDCGAERLVKGQALREGTSQSCGCLNKESVSRALIKRNTTHGMRRSRVYGIWSGMHQRCKATNGKFFKNYASKGIVVCDAWASFEQFFKDMGEPPSIKHSIDRIDNSKGYMPRNCRWATMHQQENNRTNNHLVTIYGRTQTIMSWSREFGINRKTIERRLERGWTSERAVTEPVVKGRPKR